MPVITGIVPSPDQPDHVVILVDGAPFATVPRSAVDRLALVDGADASHAEVFAPMDRATQKTYDRALNMLAFRGRSSHELRQRLIDTGEPAEQIDAVFARLEASGLIDDAHFAAQRARSGVVGKAQSRRRVEQDLSRRGIARDVASKAIAQVMADEGTDEVQIAERAARKKLRMLAHLPPAEQRQKLYAYLARQGYAFESVKRALRTVLDERAPDPDEG